MKWKEQKPARILIVDDHAVVRQGLRRMLGESLEEVEFGEAANAQEAMTKVAQQRWDLVLLDITMPNRSGMDVLKDFRKMRPALPVLILSMHPEDQFALRALRSGASGYITKSAPPDDFVEAMQKILAGGKYISRKLAEQLAADSSGAGEKPLHEALSDREYQVLRLIGSGMTIKAVAGKMSLSVKTVSTYRVRLLQKMKMKANAELMRYAMENELTDA